MGVMKLQLVVVAASFLVIKGKDIQLNFMYDAKQL